MSGSWTSTQLEEAWEAQLVTSARPQTLQPELASLAWVKTTAHSKHAQGQVSANKLRAEVSVVSGASDSKADSDTTWLLKPAASQARPSTLGEGESEPERESRRAPQARDRESSTQRNENKQKKPAKPIKTGPASEHQSTNPGIQKPQRVRSSLLARVSSWRCSRGKKPKSERIKIVHGPDVD